MSQDGLGWVVLIIAVACAAGALYYKYEVTRPCATPVVYSIGSIDPRFGTNSAELTSDLAHAAAIWNKAAGKTLFTLAPSGGVSVNLVYDSREATAKQGQEITQEEAALDQMRATIDAEKEAARTPEQAAAVNADIDAFNAKTRALNAEIADFNKGAGHPFEEGEFVSDSSGERIDVFEFVGTDQLERVLAHELGHALGLDHNGNPDSIMYANNESGNLVPSADDVAALKSLCGLQ